MKQFIDKDGIKALDNYQYKGGEYSWLDKKINPYWIKLSEFLPMSMAPNTVTLIGFVQMISSYAFIMYYDISLKEDVPNWLFLKAAVDFLIYQTLDAMDGKQARRTKSSSPLGQLFDHGCDCFSSLFFNLVLTQAQKLDNSTVLLSFLASQNMMFHGNWMEYHTHTLITQYGNFGVTEIQYISAMVCLVSGTFGQQIFTIQLLDLVPNFIFESLTQNESIAFIFKPFFDLSLGNAHCYFICFIMSILFITTFLKTITQVKKGNKLYAVSMYIPLVCILFMLKYWQGTDLYEKYAGLILLSFGVLQATLTTNLIICSLTKMKFKIYHIQVVVYSIFTVFYFLLSAQFDLDFWYYSFGLLTILNILYTLYFVGGVIEQITKHLGIYCFSLAKRPLKID